MTLHSRLLSRSVASATCVLVLCMCLAPRALAQGGVATPAITPDGGGIAPDGVDVSVACDTIGATIRYTLDGTTPTTGSTEYTGTVRLDEETGLTATKIVTFSAKAFLGAEESAVATADFTNFVDPEFTFTFAVDGTGDGLTVTGVDELVFGYLTDASDSYGPEDGEATGTTRADTDEQTTRDDEILPPVPMPPVPDVRMVTADRQLTATDFRSRTQAKMWETQVQLISIPAAPGGTRSSASIVLSWDGIDLPYLHFWRYTDADNDGTFELTEVDGGDLTVAGQLVVNEEDWVATPDEEGEEGDPVYRVFYIVYRNQGTLTANLSDDGGDGRWYYRGLDEDVAALHGPYASGDAVNVYPGQYEVSFVNVAGRRNYTPPSQTVTVAAEETTTVEATYTTEPASAAMTVLDTYYDPTEAGTVRVTCSFTYSPELTLESLAWDFGTTNPPADWALTSLSGADAAAASLGGRTVTFASARTIPAGSSIEFTANFTYGVQSDEPPTVTFAPTVTAQFAELGENTVINDLSGTSEPRTATLDVNGDGTDKRRDIILILRYLPRAQGGFAQSGNGLFPEGEPQADDAVDAATLTANIQALLPLLDVNGDGTPKRRDLILILRSLPRAQGGFAQSGNAIFPEGAPQADDAVDAATLEQNIQSILTAN